MKRMELLTGLVAAVFGLLLLAFVPGAWTATTCVAGGSLPASCLGSDAFTAAVGALLALLFLFGGAGTAGYALVSARPR